MGDGEPQQQEREESSAKESEPALEAKESAEPAEDKEPLGKLLLINLHMFLRVTIGCSNMASEPVHAVALCGGDVAAVRG